MFLLSDATQESFYLKKKKRSFYSLFTAHLIRSFVRRLVCRIFAFLHLDYQLWKNKKKGWSGGFWWFLLSKHTPPTFSGVENAVGLGVADVATFGFAVMLKSADLTEVMFAPAAGKRIFTTPAIVLGATVLMRQPKLFYFVTMGFLKESLQMKHLKGRSSSSLLTS